MPAGRFDAGLVERLDAARRAAADFRLRNLDARARPRRARRRRERRDLRLGNRRCRDPWRRRCGSGTIAQGSDTGTTRRRNELNLLRQRRRCAWLRVRSGEGKSGWPWCRFRSSCTRRPESGAQIQFHQVHEPTGKRIKYEKVVPGVGPVDRDEIVKGYEVSKGHYVLLDPEEIESVKLESRKTLDLVEFVDDGRHRRDVFRQALLRRARRRPRRGSLCRPSRCAQGGEEDRRRPARDARPGICRRAEAVRARPAARDACATPTRSTSRRASSATSATTSPTPTCSTWPRC